MSKRIGLVAGRDNLPFEALREIINRGAEAVVVGVKGEVDSELGRTIERYKEIGLGNLQEIIDYFVAAEVSEVVFAGKVGKQSIFAGGFDALATQLLASLPQKNDDAILLAVVKEFERNGITVAEQTDYLRNILIPEGAVLGELTETESKDVALGFKVAKFSGGLDIGQSVVVKSGVVLAVEAIEGTDKAIIRGGELGGAGSVVVKVSKPSQDKRFDVPTIGEETIRSMTKVGAGVLAVEAGETFFTQRETVLKLADAAKIKIVAVSE